MARILVIEDNPTNLQLMVYLLQAFGHEALQAADGEEGIAVMGRERPELVLCDVQLPRLDGYGVARHVKADLALRHVPLIAVTALAMVGDRDHILAAGFDGYIAKPIAPETFVSQAEAFLERRGSAPSPLPPAAAEESQRPGSGPGRATILVVDNAPVNLRLARSTLEPSGYRLVTAGSTSEALEIARKTPPDLILSDIHMPHESGFDLIGAVRADPRLRSIPVAFITSAVLPEKDRDRARMLGAVRFILRPIEPEALLVEIESCLKGTLQGGNDPGR